MKSRNHYGQKKMKEKKQEENPNSSWMALPHGCPFLNGTLFEVSHVQHT